MAKVVVPSKERRNYKEGRKEPKHQIKGSRSLSIFDAIIKFSHLYKASCVKDQDNQQEAPGMCLFL